jgi:hypothetical protein
MRIIVRQPRVFLARASSAPATAAKGFPCKDARLREARVYCEGDRLHVCCGESLVHSASYLKVAATALVARCLSLCLKVEPGPLGVSPVRALAGQPDLSLSALCRRRRPSANRVGGADKLLPRASKRNLTAPDGRRCGWRAGARCRRACGRETRPCAAGGRLVYGQLFR